MKTGWLASLVLLSLLAARPAAADSPQSTSRSVVQLAPGVYSIRHEDAPDTFPQGNTTVVVGERGALVVDSCYLPSSARRDIDQIREWTNKPVRYLVNTHWHYDHTMGNGVYWQAFPGLEIVAHAETARQAALYNPGWFERFPRRADAFRKILAEGKDPNGKVLSAGDIQEYETALAGLAPVQREFASLRDKTATITFDSQMTIDLGGLQVQVLHLGRGNTAGDAIVYLPKERILVAGDLVVHPVPYLFGGYPSEFVQTLRALDRMDFDVLVPGHGEVLRGPQAHAYLSLLQEFTTAVSAEVDRQVGLIGNGESRLEAVREAVQKSFDAAPWRERFAGSDQASRDAFDAAYAGLITAAHAEAWVR
jgi:glyoxylase-like metal-dependent hydrolase (beta-lactamase superfamily II)